MADLFRGKPANTLILTICLEVKMHNVRHLILICALEIEYRIAAQTSEVSKQKIPHRTQQRSYRKDV